MFEGDPGVSINEIDTTRTITEFGQDEQVSFIVICAI